MKLKTNQVFLLILAAGFILRIWNLDVIPAWRWDDGVNMNIAWNLINGRLQWFTLSYVFVPHPPLYFIILGVMLKTFGNEIIVLRSLTVAYSIAAIILVYLIGRMISGRNAALLASFIYAVYPDIIYWDRMGFANTQLMLFSLVFLYSVLKFFHGKKKIWIYLSSIAAGLSTITEYQGIMFLISLLLIFWIYERKNLLTAALTSSSFIIIFTAVMLFYFPDAFIHDIYFQLNRFDLLPTPQYIYLLVLTIPLAIFYYYRKFFRHMWKFINPGLYMHAHASLRELKEFLSISAFLTLCVINLILAFSIPPISDVTLFKGTSYLWLGGLGIFLVDRRRERNILLLFFLPILLLTLKIDRSDHMLIPLYPLLALGMPVFLQRIFGFLDSFTRFRVLSMAVLLLLLYPFAFMLCQSVSAFILCSGLTAEDVEGRYEVAGFVNNHVDGDDVVIADSHLCRLIKCRTSVLLQAVAFEGVGIGYMAPDYGVDRFVFNCSYSNARFIIINTKSVEWMIEHAEVNEKMREIHDEIMSWQLVESNNYLIYRNPALP